MVLAQGIADRMKERRERFKAELIAQGMAQGKTVGRAELAAEIVAWNQRRLDAESRGEKFDEPPPMS